jgi:hypothetical protein
MNLTRIFCLSIIFLLLSVTCFAQGAKPTSTPEPQTKIELFQARTGAVILKNFTTVGSLRGIGGTTTVTCREFVDAQTGKKEYGITIDVKESGRLERENRSYVDYDEIDSLIKGIDYILKIDNSVTKLKNFEANYRTKGSLEVSVFNDAEGIETGVTVGNIGSTSVYFKPDDFQNFRKLIVEAKATLDAIK